MTEKQGKIFSQILDLNWDMNREPNASKKFELAKQLGTKKEELKADMGEEAYVKFFENGKKMFAPKTD